VPDIYALQVLSALKSYMVEDWRSSSGSFLLDDASLPLPTSEIVAELDDRVSDCYNSMSATLKLPAGWTCLL
jgi:hypothetical protein